MNPFLAEYGPYEPGSPEDIEFQRGRTRGVTLSASQVLPAWATQLVPWGKTEEGSSGWNLPGALTGLYSAAGTYGPKAGDWAARQLGFRTSLPQLPGTERATEMYENSARWAKDTIPAVQPETDEEAKMANIMFGGASMALPLPGGAVTSLPRVARGIAHAVLPTGAVGGSIGVGATAAIQGYQDRERDKIFEAAGLGPEDIKNLTAAEQSGNVDLTQPDTSPTVAHPQTGAAATVPFPISLISGAQAATPTTTAPSPSPASTPQASGEDKYETLAEFGRPDIKVLTPDLHSTGDTKTSLPEAIGVAGVGAVVAPLIMRYGGRVFNPAIKMITREGSQINTAANNAKFNANLDRVDRGLVTEAPEGRYQGAVRGEAPLPDANYGAGVKRNADSPMSRFAQRYYDKNRVLTEYSNAVAPNKDVAKELEAQIGTINSNTPMMNSIAEQMATGVNKANGGRLLPKLKEILQDADNLTTEQQRKLDKGLHMSSELNTRDIKFGQAVSGGRSIADDAAFRHNYRNTHSDVLRAARADMMADPATADIAQRLWALQSGHANHAFDMGRLTQRAAQDMVRDRPNHVPSVDTEGNVVDPLTFMNIKSLGWETPPIKALDAYTQYYAKVHAELRTNRLHDTLFRNAELYQRANPGAARVINEIFDRNGNPVESAPGRTHTIWRDGVAHTFSIDNTNLHSAIKGGEAQTKMLINTADAFRRSFQSGTTGVMASVVAQRPFPIINLNRNIAQIAASRYPGTSFGVADRAVQRGTRGRFGYLGPEPSQWVGSYNQAIRGSGAEIARYMSDALKRNGNPLTAILRKTKGDAWVDAWSASLEHRWNTSNAGMRAAEGATGGGSGGVYDRPTYNITRGNQVAYSPMADIVPGIFHPDGIAIPYTKVRIPGTKGLTSSYINMRTLLRRIHQQIGDGANSYYWKGMKDNPNISEAQRVFNTRSVLGDPSVSGAGATAQWASHVVPWINPTIQDAVRMGRNLRDNPVSFVLGTVHTLGMSALGSLLSAMLGGNKHLNMLGRLMTTHDRASNVTFFHNPDNEHDYTQISLPQRWRMLYPIILQASADGLGAFNMHQDEDIYHRVLHTLADLYDTDVSHSTAVASREGLKDFVGVAQAPSIQTLMALAGKRINEPISQAIDNIANNQPLNANMVPNAGSQSRLPGQAAGSSYVSNDDGDWVHQVLKSVYGIAGDAMFNHLNGIYGRLTATHDIADAFDGLVSDAGQSWRDQAPFGNMIWGNNVKLQARNPLTEANDATWRVITDPKFPKTTDVTAAGLSREGGVPILGSGGVKISPDPRIRQMVTVVNTYVEQIRSSVEPQLRDVKAQIKDIDTAITMPPQFRRSQRNDLVAKQTILEQQKSLILEKLNAQLSVMAGGKHVNARTFNPAKGMDQFHD